MHGKEEILLIADCYGLIQLLLPYNRILLLTQGAYGSYIDYIVYEMSHYNLSLFSCTVEFHQR